MTIHMQTPQEAKAWRHAHGKTRFWITFLETTGPLGVKMVDMVQKAKKMTQGPYNRGGGFHK